MDRLTLALLILTAPLWLYPLDSADATAGFAEISILTPGGNSIHENAQHDLVLSTRSASPVYQNTNPSVPFPGDLLPDREIVVGIKRWRYFPGFVVGESKGGYFIFQESSRAYRALSSDEQLETWMAQHQPPIGPWLTREEAKLEAGFPLFVWYPCRVIAGKLPAAKEIRDAFMKSPDHTPELCAKAEDPDLLAVFRQTTWGQECRRLQSSPLNAASSTSPVLVPFCDFLLKPSPK